MRIQNILALTDFSTPAEHGLDRAATLAATHGARLRVLYVCETPPLQLADPAARLEQRARQLARRHGVPVTAVIGTGRPLDDCLAEAERADLLVAHGRMHRSWPVPPWRTLLYPLLRRCPCPVLVVCRPPQGPYARVLVAVDFSAASRPLVRYAGDFETGAALELFHAIDTHDEARLRSAEASTAAVQAYRREVLQCLPLDQVEANGYSFLIEMKHSAWRAGFRLAETPITFMDRTNGVSKMSGAIIREAIWVVWKVLWKGGLKRRAPERPHPASVTAGTGSGP